MSKVPLGIQNQGSDCFIISLFQALVNNDDYFEMFQDFAPASLRDWVDAMNNYKTSSTSISSSALRTCIENAPDWMFNDNVTRLIACGQQDAVEYFDKLMSRLPTGQYANHCREHFQEPKLIDEVDFANPVQRKKCKIDRCPNFTARLRNAEVSFSFVYKRLVAPYQGKDAIVIDNPTPTQLKSTTRVKYQSGLGGYRIDESEPQTGLALDLPHSTPISFDGLIDEFSIHALEQDHRFKFQGVDEKGTIRTFETTAEITEIVHGAIPPKHLPIQLKRFTELGHKITAHVDIPLEYNFCKLFSDENLPSLYNYELVSFIAHLGNCREGGHYICFVCTSPPGTPLEKKSWHNCNDAHIIEHIPSSIAQKAAKQAYLLFYRRVEPSFVV